MVWSVIRPTRKPALRTLSPLGCKMGLLLALLQLGLATVLVVAAT